MRSVALLASCLACAAAQADPWLRQLKSDDAAMVGASDGPVDCVDNDSCYDDGCPSDHPNKVKVGGGCCLLWLGDCKKCCTDPVPDDQQCSNSATEQLPAHKRPYFGFQELNERSNEEPERDVRHPVRSQQSLNFTEDGKHIHLVYDVEHHDAPLLSLDHDAECIASIGCQSAAEFTVSFCHAEDAASALADFDAVGLLAGGAHWNCSEDGPGPPKVILRKTHGVHRAPGDNRTIVLSTSQAKYQDFFKHAKIRFGTNMFHATEHAPPPATLTETERLGWVQVGNDGVFDSFAAFLREVWAGVKSIGEDLKEVVHYVKVAAVAIMKGDLHCNYKKALTGWDVNYNASTGSVIDSRIPLMTISKQNGSTSVDGELALVNSYAHFETDVVFELDINSYVIEHVQLYAEGQARVNVEGSGHLSGAFKDSGVKSMGTYNVPYSPKFVVLGIPFIVDIKIPVQVGYDLSVSASAELSASASAYGNVKYGFLGSCTSRSTSDCDFHQYSDYAYDHHAGVHAIDVDIDFNLQFYLLPTIVLVIDHIGGPNMGVKTYLEQKVGVHNNYCTGKGYGAQAITNVGLEITAGADVNIGVMGNSFWDKSWGPWGIWSKKMPIWSGCFDITTGLSVSMGAEPKPVSDGLVPGTTWTGKQRKLTPVERIAAQAADKLRSTADCWEAHVQDFPSCRGYATLGYTCVRDYCASMDPQGTPDTCAVPHPGMVVDKLTGRCVRPRDPGGDFCSDYPDSVEMSLQIVEHNHTDTLTELGGISPGSMWFVGSQTYKNDEGDDPYGCIVQSGYYLLYNRDGAALIPTTERAAPGAPANSANWAKCTYGPTPLGRINDEANPDNPDNGRGIPVEPLTFIDHGKGFVCTEGDIKQCSITLRDTKACTQLELTMADVSAPPKPHVTPEQGGLMMWLSIAGGCLACVVCTVGGVVVVRRRRYQRKLRAGIREPLNSSARTNWQQQQQRQSGSRFC